MIITIIYYSFGINRNNLYLQLRRVCCPISRSLPTCLGRLIRPAELFLLAEHHLDFALAN